MIKFAPTTPKNQSDLARINSFPSHMKVRQRDQSIKHHEKAAYTGEDQGSRVWCDTSMLFVLLKTAPFAWIVSPMFFGS
jgi:hypothetical protein